MSGPYLNLAAPFGEMHPAVVRRQARDLLRAGVAGLIVVVLGLAIVRKEPEPNLWGTLAIAAGLLGLAYLLLSPRLEIKVMILAVYLGCLDGPVKLLTSGGNLVSAFRDLVIFVVVLGAIFHHQAKGGRLTLPPLSGWIVALVAVVFADTFNPNTAGLLKALGGYRQELEWVPFFFFGYALIRSKQRLRRLFLVLAVIAAANAVVSAYQVRLTPHQFAAWGKGYSEKVLGTNGVSGTTFYSQGSGRVRPLALGSDIGFGGTIAVIALPGTLMLLATGRPRRRWIFMLLCLATLLGVAVSLSRTDVVGALVTLIAFALLSFSAGSRVIRPLMAVLVMLVIAVPLTSVLTHTEGSAIFTRYASLKPEASTVESTAGNKSVSLHQIPKDIANDPFGFGLGTSGAASTFGGHTTVKLEGHGFSSETEYNLITNELGLPGLVLWLGFSLTLAALVLRRLPGIADVEARIALAAVFAALFGLTIMGFAGAFSAGQAGGPFFWFGAGVAAYWLAGPGRRSSATLAGSAA